jgi:membrane-bound lytic murein transglycosylase F
MLASFRYFLTVAIALLLCFSCNNSQKETLSTEPAVEIDLNAIIKRGYITALVDNNSVSYFIYKGRPMGYEYELLQSLAKQLKVNLKIKITSGVEHAIEQINAGEGDILAFPLSINKSRKDRVAFTKPQFNSYHVLVQRKPDNWPKQSLEQIEDSLIRNPADLSGKEVHVLKGTSFELRLKHLTEELGVDINIRPDTLSPSTESLIDKVAQGEIDYTVATHTLAQVNSTYYPNLDVATVLSVPQQIAWAVRKNSPQLLTAINSWLVKIKRESTFMVIYNRYFKSPRTSLIRRKSDYSSIKGNKISPYDKLIKSGAEKLDWDWRLLAAVIYQESKFKQGDVSWAGAQGLMQLMPETAKRFGAVNPRDPAQNIKAGVNYLVYLNKYWSKNIKDENERLKFILASYNAGLSHILDARKLTQKYGKDATLWHGNVEEYLLKKSNPTYYSDPIALAGYCKCEEPVNYVNDVLARFEEYKSLIKN